MKKLLLATAGAVLLLGDIGAAHATFVDFTTYAPATSISSVSGINLSLIGGPESSSTVPATGGEGGGVTNSPTGEYPTAQILDFSFSSPASGIQFYFNNEGSGEGGGLGDSYWSAFDGATLLGTGSLTSASEGGSFNIGLTGVTDLQFNNNSDGITGNWIFHVDAICFDGGDCPIPVATPEPATLTMFGAGLLGLGAIRRRRRARVENALVDGAEPEGG